MLLFWILFNLFVVAMLALDLGVLNRRFGFREALAWSGVWIALAAAFAVLVLFWHGRAEALQFVTGYVIELSLSVDNLFVFLVIFRYFKVPDEHQHKVLFVGILGALLMRGVFIVAGVGLIRRFSWITYAFGALLVYSGLKLLRQRETEIHPEKNPVLRLFRRAFPVTEEYVDGQFFTRRFFAGKSGLYATPLLVVLLVVETSDILLCGGFDSGGARHHAERFYCLYLERVRHSRPALDVLCAGGNDGPVSLPSLRTVGGADFRGD